MLKKHFVLIIFNFLLFCNLNAQDLKFCIKGQIFLECEDSLTPGVKIKILKNNKRYKKYITSQGSDFMFELDFQYEYLLKFIKRGYVTKEIIVNTIISKELIGEGFQPWPFYIKLFNKKSEKGKIKIINPIARVSYNQNKDIFDYERRLSTGTFKKAKSDSTLMDTIALQLDSIFITDQKYRNKLSEVEKKYGLKSIELKSLLDTIKYNDSLNLLKVTKILATYGWLGISLIGSIANDALFLVIQHSDIKVMEKYLPLLKDAVKDGRAWGSQFALLIDRIEMINGRKQIYGSQIQGNSIDGYKIYPIEDEKNVNKRRAEVGLKPLEEYVIQWGIRYVIPE